MTLLRCACVRDRPERLRSSRLASLSTPTPHLSRVSQDIYSPVQAFEVAAPLWAYPSFPRRELLEALEGIQWHFQRPTLLRGRC
jgi:hypothetical protein